MTSSSPAARWQALRAADTRDPEEVAALVTLLAVDRIQAGAQPEALQLLAEAAGWGVVHPNMFFLQGLALEGLLPRLPEAHRPAALAQAVQALRLGLQRDGQPVPPNAPLLPGATSWAASARLGACLLALGQTDAARAALEAAHAAQPALEDVRLNLAEVLLDTDPARALVLLEGAAGADAALLRAAAFEAGGTLDEMGRALLDATEQIRAGGLAEPRRKALMDELVALLGILQGNPRPGWGAMGALAGLMSGYPPEATAAFPAHEGSATRRRLGHVIGFLQARGEQALLAALREPPVQRLFPGAEGLLAPE